MSPAVVMTIFDACAVFVLIVALSALLAPVVETWLKEGDR